MLRIKDSTAISEAVLGQNYQLSIAWVGAAESRRLNRLYRGHDRPTNILSFPLNEREGELILHKAKIEKEAKELGRSTGEHLTRLFIHGVLHLKGYRHGSRMEAKEHQLFRRFFHHVKNYRYRARHRHPKHPTGGVRTAAR